MKKRIYSNMLRLSAFMLTAGILAACGNEDIDNAYSRNKSVIQLATSGEYIVLDENNPDGVALTLEWNEAHPYGNEYITTYQYQMEAVGSKSAAIKEYEDDGMFRREYTNRELHELLTGHFGCLTSTVNTLSFTVTASFEGPRVVIPDIATATIRVKTYGEKQFIADRLSIGGTAVGDNPIELKPTSETSKTYTWNGALAAGKINFPVVYGDENNAVSPANPDQAITTDEMPAIMADASQANYWIIPESGNYRITVNLEARTVKIVAAGSVIELDKLYLSGTAVGGEDVEIERTLEDDQLFAWRGELKAGKLFMPLLYEEAKSISFVPKDKGNHDINDGNAHEFDQTSTESGTGSAYWEIPANGTYRIVVNLDERTVTIYSAATDLKNTVVSYNNTVDGINPYSQEVTELWMWGGFNASAHDDGMKAGFQTKYKMKQSLANPNVFVYHGDPLPRSVSTDDWSKATATGALNFLVSNIENNVYAFGSTADAERNKKRGYLTVNNGETLQLVAGQSHNRYAFFCVPENCTYVVVNIEKLTVYFGNK